MTIHIGPDRKSIQFVETRSQKLFIYLLFCSLLVKRVTTFEDTTSQTLSLAIKQLRPEGKITRPPVLCRCSNHIVTLELKCVIQQAESSNF